MDHVAERYDNTPPELGLWSFSPASLAGLVIINHHQNFKQGHGFKVKMALSTNLTLIYPNSKYIERYMELKFEVHELSCFDLTSKQLNLLAYIGRTSDNQGSKRIDEN